VVKTANPLASSAEVVAWKPTLGEKYQAKVATGRSRSGKENIMTDAYCVKCRAKREIAEPVQITMKNGKPAIQGKCSVCGAKVFRIGK